MTEKGGQNTKDIQSRRRLLSLAGVGAMSMAAGYLLGRDSGNSIPSEATPVRPLPQVVPVPEQMITATPTSVDLTLDGNITATPTAKAGSVPSLEAVNPADRITILTETLKISQDQFIAHLGRSIESVVNANIRPLEFPVSTDPAFPIKFNYDTSGISKLHITPNWDEFPYYYFNTLGTQPLGVSKLVNFAELGITIGGSPEELTPEVESLLEAHMYSYMATTIQMAEKFYDISQNFGMLRITDTLGNPISDRNEQIAAGRSIFFVNISKEPATDPRKVSYGLPLFMIAQTYGNMRDEGLIAGNTPPFNHLDAAFNMLNNDPELNNKVTQARDLWLARNTLLPPDELIEAGYTEPLLTASRTLFDQINLPPVQNNQKV